MNPKPVDVSVLRGSRAAHVPSDTQFRRWVAAAAGSDHAWCLSIRIVGERIGRGLNARYRGLDRATNVLSFRSDVPAMIADAVEKQAGVRPLGDLVICAPVVKSQALKQGKAISDHWAHLVVHGVLHLLGHDHETRAEARAMEDLERKILSGLGVADPYAAHGASPAKC
jgi:probable rRNA maturation factor